ncbi:MAG: hypothetical protein BroJett040_13350 [Oligoflexia bacterium]|nr:MAG: hypothetical protein BroJett040_13350 [Oligoflexia bacterium]
MLPTLRAAIKLVLFLFIVLSFILTSLVWKLVIRNISKRRWFYTRTLSFYCRLCLWAASTKVRVLNLPKNNEQHALIVSNHVGMLDILILASIRPTLFITSFELKESPGVGLLTEMGGCLYVERRNRANITLEIHSIRQALEQGYNVVLFPEATATNGERVIPFKKSLMTAAAGTGIPIQPVVLNYRKVNGEPMSHKWRDYVFWYGDQTFPPALWRLLSVGSVEAEAEFLKPVICHTHEDRRMVAQHAYDEIVAKYTPILAPHPEVLEGCIPTEV